MLVRGDAEPLPLLLSAEQRLKSGLQEVLVVSQSDCQSLVFHDDEAGTVQPLSDIA
jgi:hypothetical protein